MINILGKKLEERQEQQLKYLVLILLASAGFYFFVYLPDQQRQQFEMQIQETIDKVTKAQPNEYSALLTTCRNYLKWETEGSPIQQEALENMKEELDKAIQWLINAEKHLADENQQARTEEEREQKRKVQNKKN